LELTLFILFLLTVFIRLCVIFNVWYCYRYITDLNTYRNQSFFNLRNSNQGYIGENEVTTDELNAYYKVEDEFTCPNRSGSPPKYEEIVMQIKQTNNCNENIDITPIINQHENKECFNNQIDMRRHATILAEEILPTTSANASPNSKKEKKRNLSRGSTSNISELPSYKVVTHCKTNSFVF
jgi:hypothetical protein